MLLLFLTCSYSVDYFSPPLRLTLDDECGLTGDLSEIILHLEHVFARVLDPNIDDDQYDSFSLLYDARTL